MARRFGRRRKPRVVWLPNTGSTESGADTAAASPSYIFFQSNIALGEGANPSIEAPLVTDNPQGLGQGTIAAWDSAALSQQETFGYRLRRIVGCLTVAIAPAGDGAGGFLPAPGLVVCSAGFIIRRVDDTGNAVATGLGVSANSLGNIQDPWIWRRSWLLRCPEVQQAAGTTVIAPIPAGTPVINHIQNVDNTNLFRTGPNCTGSIDQKTARNVGAEERLFIDVSFRSTDNVDIAFTTISAMMFLDYRVLASLRVGTGNRRNAVR